MHRIAFLACAVALISGAGVWADIPLPKGLKSVDPRVRFDGIEKHADHVFYLRFLTFTGSPANVPHTLLEVKDSKPFNLNAQRRLDPSMILLALERKDFDKRKQDDPSLKWLHVKTTGALKANVAAPNSVVSVNLKEVPVTEYRVAIKDGKLTAEMVNNKSRTEAPPAGLLPPVAFGLVSAVSLGWVGVWYARKRRGADGTPAQV